MDITHKHVMSEADKFAYLTKRQSDRAKVQCWSPPELTKEEKEAREAYIKLNNLPF